MTCNKKIVHCIKCNKDFDLDEDEYHPCGGQILFGTMKSRYDYRNPCIIKCNNCKKKNYLICTMPMCK